MRLIFSCLLALTLTVHSAFALNAPTVPGQSAVSTNGYDTTAGDSIYPLSALIGSGRVFTISAGDWVGSLTAGNFYPFYKDGVAYQVTSGKTAYCWGLTGKAGAASAIQLVSATASFAYNAGSITGGVYQGGVAGKYPQVFTTAYGRVPGTYSFAATTYPGIQAGASNAIMAKMDCVEN